MSAHMVYSLHNEFTLYSIFRLFLEVICTLKMLVKRLSYIQKAMCEVWVSWYFKARSPTVRFFLQQCYASSLLNLLLYCRLQLCSWLLPHSMLEYYSTGRSLSFSLLTLTMLRLLLKKGGKKLIWCPTAVFVLIVCVMNSFIWPSVHDLGTFALLCTKRSLLPPLHKLKHWLHCFLVFLGCCQWRHCNVIFFLSMTVLCIICSLILTPKPGIHFL